MSSSLGKAAPACTQLGITFTSHTQSQVEIDTDKLPMEVGHTTFKDSSKPLYHPPVPRKSFSSHNLSELQNSTNKEQPAANPDTLSPGYASHSFLSFLLNNYFKLCKILFCVFWSVR